MKASATRRLRTRARARLLASALALCVHCLGLCAGAYAQSPTGDFAPFSQCPRFTIGVELCLFARVTGGEVGVGNLTVPVGRPIVLQAGIILDRTTFAETVVNALNGETLSKAPQAVPGGLLGMVSVGSLPRELQRSFQESVSRGLTSVTATTELVGSPGIDRGDLINMEGTGLSLPVRIKLDNVFLGADCYVGSRAHPVVLNLTTGETAPPPPNKPIAGEIGRFNVKDEFEFIGLSTTTLVDNAFSVPGVTGCGGSLAGLLDPLVDAKLGLPSVAGHSTAILKATIEEATTVGVIASER